jgi:hypothetical protein
MTRETKVGILVSCSFLCLVGLVVFYKLRQGDPATGQVAAAAPNEEKLDPEQSSGAPAKAPEPNGEGGKPGAPAPPSAPGGVSPEPAEHMPKLQRVPSADGSSGIQPVAAVASEATPAPPLPPSLGKFWNQPSGNSQASQATAEGGDKMAPPRAELPSPDLSAPVDPTVALPPPVAPAVPPPVAPTAITKSGEPAAPPLPSPVATAPPKLDANPKASAGGTPGGEDKAPLAEASAGGDKLPNIPSPAEKTSRTTVGPTMPEPGAAAPGDKAQPSAAPAPPALPSAVPVASPVPPEPTKPVPPPEPAAAVSPQTESGANLGKPVPAPGSATAPTKPDVPPAAAPAPDDAPPEPRVKLVTPSTPPGNEFAQGPPPPAAPAPARALPPVGAVPAATSPPLVAPSPAPVSRPPAPQVESFDEETYSCRPGDTFESVTRAKYQSPKYAQALLLYNRAHPVAGDSFQGGVTTLRIGQAIYLPPAAILEKRFGDAIQNPVQPAASPERPSYSSPAPPAAGAYRVGGGGEYLRAVAMRALADSERWQEILRLNPSVNPAYPVPPGTVLRLPPDARVPAENTP